MEDRLIEILPSMVEVGRRGLVVLVILLAFFLYQEYKEPIKKLWVYTCMLSVCIAFAILWLLIGVAIANSIWGI